MTANPVTTPLWVKGIRRTRFHVRGVPQPIEIQYPVEIDTAQPITPYMFNPGSWTTQTGSPDDLSTVAWSPALGMFAAASFPGAGMWTSLDGATWTSRGGTVNGIISMIWVPELGKFVGVSASSAANANKVITSSDGITWTTRTLPVVSFALNDVTWSPELGLLVAVGGGSVSTATNVYTSPDGITWTGRTTPTATQYDGVAWSPSLGLFAAVRNSSTSMTSPNGINWTNRTIGGSNWLEIGWSPTLNLFVVCGAPTAQVRTSPDGITWSIQNFAGGATQWRRVKWIPELARFVMVGFSGTEPFASSPDGTTWTPDPGINGGNHNDMAFSPSLGLMVVASLNAEVKTSP